MGLWKFTPAEAPTAPAIACTSPKVYACTRSGCQKTLAKGNNLRAAVEVNVKEKNLFSGLFDEEGALENSF